MGYLYGNFTISLGYKAERHEGKLTGLAAYTKPPKDYNQINPFYVKNGKIKTKNIKGIYIPFFNRLKNSKWNLNKFNKKVRKWLLEYVRPSNLHSGGHRLTQIAFLLVGLDRLDVHSRNVRLLSSILQWVHQGG